MATKRKRTKLQNQVNAFLQSLLDEYSEKKSKGFVFNNERALMTQEFISQCQELVTRWRQYCLNHNRLHKTNLLQHGLFETRIYPNIYAIQKKCYARYLKVILETKYHIVLKEDDLLRYYSKIVSAEQIAKQISSERNIKPELN